MTTATAQTKTQRPPPRIGGGPTRSVAAASWTALGALLLRDLVVLRKHLGEFVLRTIIQPFLLCFVFLYVFPKIGQGVGGAAAAPPSRSSPPSWSRRGRHLHHVPGGASVALAMAEEFGFTREIEDRVQAPCPIWLVAIAKVLSARSRASFGGHRAADRVVAHAAGATAHLSLHWWIIITLVPLAPSDPAWA